MQSLAFTFMQGIVDSGLHSSKFSLNYSNNFPAWTSRQTEMNTTQS